MAAALPRDRRQPAPARASGRLPREPRALTPGQLEIQIARRQLGLDEGTYRLMLTNIAGVASCKALTPEATAKVLAHLRGVGYVRRREAKPTPGRPNNMAHADRGDLLAKIEAHLLDANRPWAYADGMARRMFGIDRVSFCHEGQLHRIVAALEYDQKRRIARAQPAGDGARTKETAR